MKIDDPKLTAYALNEIDDPAEKAEVESWLASHPEAREELAEIQELAGLLGEKLRQTPAFDLHEEQRAVILGTKETPAEIVEFPTNKGWRKHPWSVIGLSALAACLAAGPLLPWTELLRLRGHSTPEVVYAPPAMTLNMPEEKEEFVPFSPAPMNQPGVMHKEIDIAPPLRELNDPLIASAPMDSTSNFSMSVRSQPRVAMAEEKSHLDTDGFNTEAYDFIAENGFLTAKDNPLSTFSIDVDTASYANVRRFLSNGQLPPKGAVRIEELLNYFTYDYAPPTDGKPFATHLEVADCPWQPEHRLVRIGLRGQSVSRDASRPSNLVFLIDVSGSMDDPNKLPLLKQSLQLLIDQLQENDRVALVVYAGQSGVVLPSTANKAALRTALDDLRPGGSTNGASGIELAYEQAVANFRPDGINRVILATDGDFNVGTTNQSDLVDLITAKAKSGVFLSVLGFGTGNLKDSTMEKLANKGNGNYAYIDSLREGKKVLVEQMGGTLVTIAKDVKIQVEFNPALVGSYRLIGYENRALKKEDFNDDEKDAGELGAGHTVTALYEVVPKGALSPTVKTDPLKYSNAIQTAVLPSGELLTVKLRYKQPTGDVSEKIEFPLVDRGQKLAQASADFRFATAVAEFGQLLRDSEHKQLSSWDALLARAEASRGTDAAGYRTEFLELVRKARSLVNREG